MVEIITFQDWQELRAENERQAITSVIDDWKTGRIYKTAVIADTYDRQENKTISEFAPMYYTLMGIQKVDPTATNTKIASNFFRRLNVQRNTYSIGNGVSFADESIKDRFGAKFDTVLLKAAYKALIHGVCFPFWNGQLNYFEATEFAPLYNEDSGVLMAGIRFWQIDSTKPMFAVVYETDGFTKWRKANGKDWEIVREKTAYIQTVQYTEADGVEIVDDGNYSALPVVPLWGNSLHQSTLIGLRSQIDAYDIVNSGFASDIQDVAQIYFLIENYGGMTVDDLAKFRDNLKLMHIAEADTSEGGKITPYQQEVPHGAIDAFLDRTRQQIYDDFGAFDVRGFSNGAKTATEIDAAYQPLDENADDFESQIIEFMQALGGLIGVPESDCVPLFKRNKISNAAEQMQALAMADWLDEETKVRHTPFITVDEQEEVLKRLSAEALDRMSGYNAHVSPQAAVEAEE